MPVWAHYFINTLLEELMIIVDRARTVTDSQPYSLIFKNNTENNWTFLCFQNQPSGLPQDYQSLAWFAMPVAPDTRVLFRWSIDYDFVWSQTGELTPGVVFTASQTKPANLTTKNQIGFTRLPNGAFTYDREASQGPDSGALTIVQDDTIPPNTASVGIGMSGSGTFAVQAQSNVKATFTPTPTYYVAFGQSVQEGEVLNISQFSSIEQIKFPVNQYQASATLEPGNRWSVSYQADVQNKLNELRRSFAALSY